MDMKKCIDLCLECHRVCLETLQHCLSMGGRQADPAHIGLLQNCASMCDTNAQFMISGTELHTETCAVCATVCDECADHCEATGDDAQMRRCTEVCRRCADSCFEMSGAEDEAA